MHINVHLFLILVYSKHYMYSEADKMPQAKVKQQHYMQKKGFPHYLAFFLSALHSSFNSSPK